MFSQPGALAAALNWYRGSRGIDPEDDVVQFAEVTTPTLFIWGNSDMAIGRAGVEAGHEFMQRAVPVRRTRRRPLVDAGTTRARGDRNRRAPRRKSSVLTNFQRGHSQHAAFR